MLNLCPCDTGLSYQQCCGPIHNDPSCAKTPISLMRSRYSAFSLGKLAHLKRTQLTPFEGPLDDTQWLQLKIIEVDEDSTPPFVHFAAQYLSNGQIDTLEERSTFKHNGEHWVYDSGTFESSIQLELPKRNDPCWCASTKKYKKCHGAR